MSRGSWKRLPKFCKSGEHEYTKANTGLKPRTGIRYCKKCAANRIKRWRKKHGKANKT